MPRADLVLLGEIVGAFGVKGEVRVKAFTAAPDGVCAYGPLLDAAGKVALTPQSWRPVKHGLAVIAREIRTREEAEALRGVRLFVPRARLPPPAPDEFYQVDLIGCRVQDEAGKPLGEVVAVHDFGAGEMLELARPHAPPLYLPFTKDAAPLVDISARRITARLPEPDKEQSDQE
jgi:16S rRNA processing protein RimM